MHIHVIQYNDNLPSDYVSDKITAIIDVFRATSVITTALAHGARKIIPVANIEDAREIYENKKDECILGGERKMKKIDGFDRGNSPLSYTSDIKNKTVILTTTNGTRTLHSARNAAEIYIASFLNAEIVAHALSERKRDIHIVCSGLRGNFALEDACCAGKIIHHMSKVRKYTLDDFSICIKNLYEANAIQMERFISESSAYNALKNIGAGPDADFCLQEDLYPVIPIFQKSVQSISLTNM